MIRLVPKFNKAEIKKALEQKRKLIEQAVLNRLKFIGERFVANARNNGNYTDRTGNLRSSIGYVILLNGVQMFGAFPGSTAEGRKKSKETIDNAKQNYPTGYVLICVAGMEYAASVESKGKDVLTGSSLIATEDLKKAIKELSEKVSRIK